MKKHGETRQKWGQKTALNTLHTPLSLPPSVPPVTVNASSIAAKIEFAAAPVVFSPKNRFWKSTRMFGQNSWSLDRGTEKGWPDKKRAWHLMNSQRWHRAVAVGPRACARVCVFTGKQAGNGGGHAIRIVHRTAEQAVIGDPQTSRKSPSPPLQQPKVSEAITSASA